ncbi:hypothetical protein OHC33_011086 [Knufia fluminis]|uniref:Nicotinamide N-methyltransferase n=1 Tax=Knufia fluminis TaxID=191047 RepID=A0AAN8E7I5_9EURO|nr:hypothetical protein OHC33_011086 [Knufia fluminis]
MLPSRVSIPPPPNPEQEDIFSSALGTLFTDDTQNSHGTPGQSVIYRSPRYGDVTLGIPRHPDVEEGRQLFAHYLWNAGVVAADAIECASSDGQQGLGDGKVLWNKDYWDVRGKDVLELGAGTALPSLVAALSAARSVTITDHPSSPALVADTIAHNVLHNLKINLLPTTSSDSPLLAQSEPRTPTQISIHGLTWGDAHFTSPTTYGKPSNPQPAKHSFDKIIVADCLWIRSQHENIVKTIDSYLRLKEKGTQVAQEEKSDDDKHKQEEDMPCALVIAGFHTGRRTVADFFEIATGSRIGPTDTQDENEHKDEQGRTLDNKGENGPLIAVLRPLHAAELFEIDIDCNIRTWQPERPGEDKDATKRWCVVGVLVRG